MPVFLHEELTGVWAVVVSVSVLFIFAEILPSAIFSGPQSLRIAVKIAFFVKLLMFLTFIISYPLAKLLDSLLGTDDDDDENYEHSRLKGLIRLHQGDDEEVSLHVGLLTQQQQNHESGKKTTLLKEQVDLVEGAIDLGWFFFFFFFFYK